MPKFLIIGSGRLARHLAQYFTYMDLPFRSWSRAANEDLTAKLQGVTHVYLCIKDQALKNFVESRPELSGRTLVHFSAVAEVPGAHFAHPLMTFGPELYSKNEYQQIPFIVAADGPAFHELLPGLANPHYSIPRERRAFYHALCVMSGNFTTILWQHAYRTFRDELGLPAEILNPYLKRVAQNLYERPEDALTGPLARGDSTTMIQHIDSLRGRPEQQLYYAVLNFVLADKKTRGEVTSHEHLRF